MGERVGGRVFLVGEGVGGSVTEEGLFVTSDGFALEPSITVPDDSTALAVAANQLEARADGRWVQRAQATGSVTGSASVDTR